MTAALVLSLSLALQPATATSDSTYASPALRALVEAAAARQAPGPDSILFFHARHESEIGLLVRQADGVQTQTGVEQVWGEVLWAGDGDLIQSVRGYRSRFAGPAFSTLSFMRGPWVFPPLQGDMLPIILESSADQGVDLRRATGNDPISDGLVRDSSRMRAPRGLVNPLGSDRTAHYSFSGGDTVLVLRLPAATIPVVRVVVTPLRDGPAATLFRGEIHLDARSHGVVRVRGEVVSRARRRSGISAALRSAMNRRFFVDVENAYREGGDWLPYRQWVELEAGSPFSEDRAMVRIVTQLSEAEVGHRGRAGVVSTCCADGERSLALFPVGAGGVGTGWRSELGAATGERQSRELDDMRTPPRASPTPTVRLGTPGLSNAVRYDRVEGLFTGWGVSAGAGPGRQGAFYVAHGGWAWSEETVRGAVEVGWKGSTWSTSVLGGRELSSTNDFSRPFATGATLLGVLGVDDFDYVDRHSAGVRATLRGPLGVSLGATVSRVADRALTVAAPRGPLGGEFRPLRAVEEGDYSRLALTLSSGGNRGGEFLTPGWSTVLRAESTKGDLKWLRVEGTLRARGYRGRWSAAWEGHGGVVSASKPPPQALFELGSWSARLPGFPYKAFTGDRTVVVMAEVMRTLPILERPLRLGRLLLPGLAPSPVVQLHAGYTGASVGARETMGIHGWSESDGIRATTFVGLRMLGGTLRVGAAQELGGAGRWRFQAGVEGG